MNLKMDVNGEGTRVYNEGLHSLYHSPKITTVIKYTSLRLAGYVDRMEEGKSVFKMLTARPIGKRPLGRPKRRWEDNIRKDLKEISASTRNSDDLAQDRDYWISLMRFLHQITETDIYCLLFSLKFLLNTRT